MLGTAIGATYEFTLKNSFGGNIIYQEDQLELAVDFSPDGLTPLPTDFYKFKSGTNMVTTESNPNEHIAKFENAIVDKAPNGAAFIFVRFSAESFWISDMEGFIVGESPRYQVEFINPVD